MPKPLMLNKINVQRLFPLVTLIVNVISERLLPSTVPYIGVYALCFAYVIRLYEDALGRRLLLFRVFLATN